MKDCGSCSLCCKLIEVPNLAPAGKWCPNCKPGSGCVIHETRPDFCRNYHCFWRAESWPDEFRPDRCKVIFEALPGVETILVSVDPSRPDAWKEKNVRKVIETLRRKGRPLVLKTKNDTEFFIPKGWSKNMIRREVQRVIDWKENTNGGTNIHN